MRDSALISQGDVPIFPALTSTSCEQDVAKPFAACCNSGQAVIYALYCSQAKDISCFSIAPEERELLLPPNCKFTVRRMLSSMQLQFTNKTQVIELHASDECRSGAHSPQFITNHDNVCPGVVLQTAHS